MAEERDRQGTGRHPHGSADEPYAHTREEDRDEGEHRDRAQEQDLKRREYRDDKGDTHHHTKTYMEQHRDEKK